ncbi:MAG TPA: tetratricopeptide repeat protein [Candidatus Tumulicola sp.]|jgi:tetratricopeptide (TPR) repeat protein
MLLAFACVQAASEAFAANAAVPYAIARHVPLPFARGVYETLARIAPAPYVTSSLAAYELERGDAASAHRYAIALPASPVRDDLLGRAAAAGGDTALAYEYYLAAPDVDAIETYIESLATRDPAAAYELERTLSQRLLAGGSHPDAVAETQWHLGLLANRRAWREIPDSPAQGFWLRRSMDAFQRALDIAPLSDRYAIAAANQAMLLGELPRSQALFAQAARSNPGSADAIAGLGVVAYELGDVRAAAGELERARRIDPNALMVRALAHDVAQ